MAKTDTASGGNIMSVLSYTVDKAVLLANANSVVGEKIVIEDMTIIPISKISVGFAGGGADINTASKKNSQQPAGSGAKVTLTPVTFLVVKGNEVKLININSSSLSSVKDTVKSALTQIKALFKK